MIKENKFFIKKLKSIIFLGESKSFKDLEKINKSLKLETMFVSSSHQAKSIDNNIKVKVFDHLDDAFKKLVSRDFDIENTLFISLGARYIFKKETINKFFHNNLVNFHNTRLPLDAGGGGFSWNILREDRINNQLVHLIDGGIDTGPIIENEINLFPASCKIPIDFKKFSSEKFLIFYKKFITKILEGRQIELKPQINYFGRYNPRLNTAINGFIDWNLNPYDLINFINAFDEPYSGALTFLNNGNFGKLSVKKAQLHGGDSSNHPFMTGIVNRHDGDWIVVSTTGRHMLIIEEVLDKNKNNIIEKIKVGDRFYTDIKDIESGKNKRVTYNSKGLKK